MLQINPLLGKSYLKPVLLLLSHLGARSQLFYRLVDFRQLFRDLPISLALVLQPFL
jgi:hypothetical protein